MKKMSISCQKSLILPLIAFSIAYVYCQLQFATCNVVNGDIRNSEDQFDSLADEYYVDQEKEKATAELERKNNPELQRKFSFEIKESATGAEEEFPEGSEIQTVPPPELEKRKESYEERTKRLSCDNPWFWNSFECVWLDLRNQNICLRTKKNMKTGAIFGGIISAILLLPICGIWIMRSCINARARRMEKRVNEIVDKLRPGVFVHPDGTRHYYEPTEEEQEAFEELLLQFASIY